MSSCRNRRGQFTRCRVGGAARGRGRRAVDRWLLKEGRDYVETVKGIPIYLDWEFDQYIIAVDPSDNTTWDFATTKRRARTLAREMARKAGSSARGRRSAEDDEWIEDFVDSLESDGDVPVSPPYTAAKKRKLWEVIATESGSKPGSFLFFKIVEELEYRGLYPSLPAWQAGMEW